MGNATTSCMTGVPSSMGTTSFPSVISMIWLVLVSGIRLPFLACNSDALLGGVMAHVLSLVLRLVHLLATAPEGAPDAGVDQLGCGGLHGPGHLGQTLDGLDVATLLEAIARSNSVTLAIGTENQLEVGLDLHVLAVL